MEVKIVLEPFECDNYSNLDCKLYKGEIEETLEKITGVESVKFNQENFTIEINGEFSLDEVKKELAEEDYAIKSIEEK